MPEAPSRRQLVDWLRLYRSDNVGPVTFRELLEKYKTAGNALDALPDIYGRGGKKLKPLPARDAEIEIERLEEMGGRMITGLDEHYPPLLGAIYDPPPVLSVLGNIELLKKRAVGIVGARAASLGGQKLAGEFAGTIGRGGFLIVSGMARGIDAAAHGGALASGTVAVVGGGVDVIYPRQNTALYNQLLQQGAIISEVALGTKPQARHFPRRNRIISGISRAVVVIEAGEKSGSLITARMALEQGRDVLAVPGSPLDVRSAGCNRLIREGAEMAETGADILSGLSRPFSAPVRTVPVPLNDLIKKEKSTPPAPAPVTGGLRERIREMLSTNPVTVDELVRSCQCSPAEVSEALLEMELAGLVERHPGGRVALLGK